MLEKLKVIGHIETPYMHLEDCPKNIRPDGPDCIIRVDEPFCAGLRGLTAGQQILVLYWFENTNRNLNLQQGGGASGKETMGTFALRSPHRPNPIAAAEMEIQSIADGQITVRGLDCLDGTKLLDIKPAILRS